MLNPKFGRNLSFGAIAETPNTLMPIECNSPIVESRWLRENPATMTTELSIFFLLIEKLYSFWILLIKFTIEVAQIFGVISLALVRLDKDISPHSTTDIS